MAKKWTEEARKACDGNCAYCEYYWQEWDESGCKLDDFESEDCFLKVFDKEMKENG